MDPDEALVTATLGTRGDVPFPVPRHRQRVDRVHLIAGRDQCLHPRPAVRLDPDHHVARFTIAEVIGDRRMQRGDPGHPFGKPPAHQSPPRLVLDLDVVVGLGPVITDEQLGVTRFDGQGR